MKNRSVGFTNIYNKEALIKKNNMDEFPMGFGRAHPDPFYLKNLEYHSSVAFPNVVTTHDLIPNNAFVGFHNTNAYIEPELKETTGQALPYPPKPEVSEPIKLKYVADKEYKSIKPKMREFTNKELKKHFNNKLKQKIKDKYRADMMAKLIPHNEKEERKEKKEVKYEIKI